MDQSVDQSVDLTEMRIARLAAPAALALFAVVAAALSDRPWPVAAGAAALAVGTGVALAWRGVVGVAALPGLVLAGSAISTLALGQPANVGWFGVCVLVGWAAYVAPTGAALALAGLLVAGFVGQWLVVEQHDAGWGAWIAGTVFTLVACLLARRQRELLAELRVAQAGLADRVAAEERTRIAHELHDVIGHALTVSLLHVTSARLALADDPDEAAASLVEAERLARQSLGEVRAVVGLMKDDAGPAPLPGAGDLDDLVDSFRRAGADVAWTVAGDLAALTATEALTAYRLLQEALTNAVRHAPGAPVRARLDVDGVSLVVVSGGGPRVGAVVEGTGLAGMRQRAALLGGRLGAGWTDDGWRVEAAWPAEARTVGGVAR